MTEEKPGSEKSDRTEIEASLTAFSRKLSDSALLKLGSILIRFTDFGEEYSKSIL
jgi:hypothetical protein